MSERPREGQARGLAWRAWALEATWTADRLQGWGVLYALLPILRRAADVPRALARHAEPFGCNLWTAPAALAAMGRLESENRGADAVEVRDRVAPPLSAAGDAFVWRAVHPAALAACVLAVLARVPLLGVAAVVLLHDVLLVRQWRRGFVLGAAHGDGLPAAFSSLRPDPRLGRVLQRALAVGAGGLAGWGLATAWAAPGADAFLMSGALVVGYHAARRRTPGGLTFVAWVLLASWIARFSNPMGPP